MSRSRIALSLILFVPFALTPVVGCDDDSDDSGEGGAAAAAVTNPDGTVDAAPLASYAVRLSICSHAPVDEVRDDFYSLLSVMVALRADPYIDFLSDAMSCAMGATDCDGVMACINVDTSQTCEPQLSAEVCNGSSRVDCLAVDGCGSVGWPQQADCHDQPGAGSGNTLCLHDERDGTECGVGTCADSYELCDGNVLERCEGGLITRTNCDDLSAICTTQTDESTSPPTSELTCQPQGLPACQEDHCDGDTAVLCQDGYEIARMACGELAAGLTCTMNLTDSPVCTALGGTDCTDGERSCQGDEARWCLNGRWASVDCASFIDGTCTINDDEEDNPTLYCSSPTWDAEVDALDGVEGNAWTTCEEEAIDGNTRAACEAYVAAINACMTAFAEGMGTDPTLTEDTFCDAYTVDVQAAADYLNCMADAYGGATCSETIPTPDCTL